MKARIVFRWMLSVMLPFLAIESGLARGSEPPGSSRAAGANASASSSARWYFATVDSDPPYDVGQHVSIALHPVNGRPYISYYEASHQMLRMASYVGTGGNCGPKNDWQCETVDHTGNVGMYSSIAIDPVDNLPIISYYDASNGALKVAVMTVFDWVFKTIDDPDLVSAGRYNSLKLSSTGKPRIAYYISNIMGIDSLWYAKYVGGGTGNCGGNDYRCDIVDDGEQMGKYASLALDSSDQPHIAYHDGANDALMYAHYNGSWLTRRIIPVSSSSGKYASLVVDTHNGDLPHIAHYNSSSGMLEYAVYVGGNEGNCGMSNTLKYEWQCDAIDNIGTGTDPKGVSIAVDGSGYPIIAYQSGGSGLKVARPAAALGLLTGNCGPVNLFYTWQCKTISMGIGFEQGDYMALALNSAGLSTIAYYGNVTGSVGDLKVAYQRLRVFLPLTLKN
ncbi:MAG: hypothetical protein E4H27_07485 [Anaerolineales bacterium]|nr:MAG: hypothetical protein E4H27_07485 [Anaerolineales bacterium]